jgi:hypothetical protein
VIFHLDRTNIKASSGAFPGLDNYDRHNRTIHVEEPSSILEIILPFAEKRGTPKLPRDLEFETLAAIAEAVEKYQIFSAMELCRTRLR